MVAHLQHAVEHRHFCDTHGTEVAVCGPHEDPLESEKVLFNELLGRFKKKYGMTDWDISTISGNVDDLLYIALAGGTCDLTHDAAIKGQIIQSCSYGCPYYGSES